MWPAGHESIKRKADHLIDNHLVPRAAPLPGSDEAELRRLAQAAAELRADADVAAAEHQKEKETRDLKKAETEGGREIRDRFVNRFGGGAQGGLGGGGLGGGAPGGGAPGANLRRSSAPAKKYSREEYIAEVGGTGGEWEEALRDERIHPGWVRIPAGVGSEEYFQVKPPPVKAASGRVGNMRDAMSSLVQMKAAENSPEVIERKAREQREKQLEEREERAQAQRREDARRAEERAEAQRREDARRAEEREGRELHEQREQQREEERERRKAEERREKREAEAEERREQREAMQTQMFAALLAQFAPKPPQPPPQ